MSCGGKGIWVEIKRKQKKNWIKLFFGSIFFHSHVLLELIEGLIINEN